MSLQTINDENCRNPITTETCDFLLTPPQTTGRQSILRPSQKENLPPKSAVKPMKVTFQTPMRDPQTHKILSPDMANQQEGMFTPDDCAAALENLHLGVSSNSEDMLVLESIKKDEERDARHSAPFPDDELSVKSKGAYSIDFDNLDNLNPPETSDKIHNSFSKVLFSSNMNIPERNEDNNLLVDVLSIATVENITLKKSAETDHPSMEIHLSTEIKPAINDSSELVTKSTCNEIMSIDPSTDATKGLESLPSSKASYNFDPDQLELIDPFKTGGSKLQNSPVAIPEPSASDLEAQKAKPVKLEFDFTDGSTAVKKPSPKKLGKKSLEAKPLAKKLTVVKERAEKSVNEGEEKSVAAVPVPKASYTINWDQYDDPNFNPFACGGSKISSSPKLQKPRTEDISTGKVSNNILPKTESAPATLKKDEQFVFEKMSLKDPLNQCSDLIVGKDQEHDTRHSAPFPDDELSVKSTGTYSIDFDNLDNLNPPATSDKIHNSLSKLLFSPNRNIPERNEDNNLPVNDVRSLAPAENITLKKSAENDHPSMEINLSTEIKPAINDSSELVTKSICNSNEILNIDPSTDAIKGLESLPSSKASYNFDPDQLELIDPFKTGGSKLQNSPVSVTEPSVSGPEAPKEPVKLEFDFTDGPIAMKKPSPKKLGKRSGIKAFSKKVAVVKEKVEKSVNEGEEKSVGDVPVPKASYTVDWDQYDDPNFNPFACGDSKMSSSPELQKPSTEDICIGKGNSNNILQDTSLSATLEILDKPDAPGSLKHMEPLNQEIQVNAVDDKPVDSPGQATKELNMGKEVNPSDPSVCEDMTLVSDRKSLRDELAKDKAGMEQTSNNEVDVSFLEMDFKPAIEFEGFDQPIEIDYLEQFGSSSFKESALRKQSLYLKFDPLLRESPQKTLITVKETSVCLTNIPVKSRSELLKLASENVYAVEPLQNEEKPKGLDLLGTFTITDQSAFSADISSSHPTPVLPFPLLENAAVDAIVDVLKYSQKDMDAAVEAVQIKIREKELEVLQWKSKHDKLLMKYVEMGKIVTEFECTITQMIEDSQKQKELTKLEMQKTLEEKQQVQHDLNFMEKSFSELFKRFEKQKDTLEGYCKNEETLKKCVEDYVARIGKEEQRYKALKAHAEEKLKRANEEIAQVRSKAKGEIAALQAMLRKEHMKIQSMEQSLEQKTKENEELTKICDDLISKMEKN
ncbi:LOW QUALITY PROTEIN: transforming acidic coiled-coil-containing protein 3 [Rhinatrema bivittatum]|uniref:LOW QUALITY PROTEIN: transforming acidic coiled-coil-containing protein 3 n=1 Tax=Rhinatrema bivittatum TaxID=194408 RepID=UPI00112713EA|nr:LOW QUALITY PROTEIN: transforming acidic coiled-coil-containing protein 3 [Rhinatrema bivittatum]